jgi:DNA-binding FadR family transcriptional regulator
MTNQAPNRSPLYAKVESALGERIVSGALAPGDRLPSEDELVAEFAVGLPPEKWSSLMYGFGADGGH